MGLMEKIIVLKILIAYKPRIDSGPKDPGFNTCSLLTFSKEPTFLKFARWQFTQIKNGG